MKHPFSDMRSAMLCLLLAGLSSQPAAAQITSGTILGTVTDTSGSVLPGAVVTVVNLDQGLHREMATDAQGDYFFPDLPLGNYRLTVQAKAFETFAREGLELHVQDKLRVDLSMRVGNMAETVTVKGAAALVRTEDATQANVINNQSIVDLPLNTRNFSQLAIMMPGVLPGIPGSTLGSFIGAGIGVGANGQREFNNAWNLDGANMNIGFYSWNSFNPSVDAIQEFTIQTALYSAEFGFQSGGNINIAIKSGTNQLHGTLYEFFQNNDMNGRNFFAASIPELRQNQFGGTIGGPIYLPKVYNGKDKTFFFFNYEGLRAQTQALALDTMPSGAQRTGDLSLTQFGTKFTGAILDPLSGAPFAGNIIPSSRIAPQAQKILPFYPLPNVFGSTSYNYYALGPQPNNTDEAITRIDHRIGNNDTVFGHYAQNSIFRPAAEFIPTFFTTSTLASHNVAINYTHIFTPRTLNNFQVSFNRSFVTQVDPRTNSAFNIQQALGIAGIPGAGRTNGFPNISIQNFTTLGDPTNSPLIQPDQVLQLTDNVTMDRGRHHLKAGIDFWHDHSERWQGIDVRGAFTFVNSNSVGSGNAFADFLLGLPSQSSIGLAPGQERLRNERYAVYFMDDWKVTPSLTLNLGLRYELASVISDTRGTVASFDLSTGQPIYFKAGQGLYGPAHNDWAPRFGFAYRPFAGDKTVIRGGYGIFYNIPLSGTLFSLESNPPFATQATFFANPGAPAISFNNPFPSGARGAAAIPSFNMVDPNYAPARIQSAALGGQQQLGQNTFLDLNVTATRSFGLDRLRLPNSTQPGPGAVQPRRPFADYGQIVETRTDARAWYYALTAKLEHRFSQGLALISSYTFSRNIDQSYSGVAGQPNDQSYPQNYQALNLETGLSGAQQKNRWVSSMIYDLPFGSGKKLLTNGVAGKIAGGWQVTAYYTAASGEQLGVSLVGDWSNVGSTTNNTRPIRTCNGNLSSGSRSIAKWFDTGCFSFPGQFHFGNSGRGIITGPALFDLDLGLIRNFGLGEKAKLQFRAEAFNAANHANFSIPGRFLGNLNFGVITGAQPARVLQLALKLIF